MTDPTDLTRTASDWLFPDDRLTVVTSGKPDAFCRYKAVNAVCTSSPGCIDRGMPWKECSLMSVREEFGWVD